MDDLYTKATVSLYAHAWPACTVDRRGYGDQQKGTICDAMSLDSKRTEARFLSNWMDSLYAYESFMWTIIPALLARPRTEHNSSFGLFPDREFFNQ
jgi:hypothetical protein